MFQAPVLRVGILLSSLARSKGEAKPPTPRHLRPFLTIDSNVQSEAMHNVHEDADGDCSNITKLFYTERQQAYWGGHTGGSSLFASTFAGDIVVVKP